MFMTRPIGDARGVGEAIREEAGARTYPPREASGTGRRTSGNVRRPLVGTTRFAAGLFAVMLATVSEPASASQLGGLRLPSRLFGASGIVYEVPTVNVPTVKATLNAAVKDGDEGRSVVAAHSRAFEEFMAKFDRASAYCPDAEPPCEESTHRERVFLENLLAIEAHNAERETKKDGGMKLGVTRFADLTPDEFANRRGRANAGADEASNSRRVPASQHVLFRREDVLEKTRGSVAGAGSGTPPPRGGTRTRTAKLGAGGAAIASRPEPRATAREAVDARVTDDVSGNARVPSEPVYDCSALVSRAVRDAAKSRLATAKPHSKPFSEFVERFGKKTAYCGANVENFPCEESYRREIVLLRNMRRVEEHNAERAKKGDGGMIKSVTRFADLTEEEFAANHATYDGSAQGLKTAARRVQEAPESSEADADAPRRALEQSRVRARRERRKAERALAAERASLGRDAALASLGAEEAPSRSDSDSESSLDAGLEIVGFESENDQTSGAEAEAKSEAAAEAAAETEGEGEAEAAEAEAALLSEEETLAADAAAALARKPARLTRAAAAAAAAASGSARKQSVLDYAASLGAKIHTVNLAEMDFPEAFDWRANMDIGPLYSQGACSGCWAYSTVQVIADSKLISSGHRPSPSPYYLLSCDDLDSGCNTGNMATAYAWIQTQPRGILSVEEYPTTGDFCAAARLGDETGGTPLAPGVTIDGFCEIPPLRGAETVRAMLKALQQQPLAIGMNVKPLQLYGGGLVQMEDCPPASSDQISAINHAAVVVGWGVDEESDTPYWLLKNSYGQDWGENGYARLEMAFDRDTNYGVCGFFSEQNYPLTDGRDCAEGSTKKWSEKRGDDVYLMPDNVVVLPNGGGILTPARIKVFGYDLTTILKISSFVCFALCVFFLVVEVYYCFVGGDENAESAPVTPSSGASPAPPRTTSAGYGSKA